MNLLSIKKNKEILKQRCNLKGVSWHNKQQLNDVLFSCSNAAYLKKKKKNYRTQTCIKKQKIKI